MSNYYVFKESAFEPGTFVLEKDYEGSPLVGQVGQTFSEIQLDKLIHNNPSMNYAIYDLTGGLLLNNIGLNNDSNLFYKDELSIENDKKPEPPIERRITADTLPINNNSKQLNDLKVELSSMGEELIVAKNRVSELKKYKDLFTELFDLISGEKAVDGETVDDLAYRIEVEKKPIHDEFLGIISERKKNFNYWQEKFPDLPKEIIKENIKFGIFSDSYKTLIESKNI